MYNSPIKGREDLIYVVSKEYGTPLWLLYPQQTRRVGHSDLHKKGHLRGNGSLPQVSL